MSNDEELLVENKPISEWANDQGWIEIGGWQLDPKTISLKEINDVFNWEINNAKREILEEIKPILKNAFKYSEHAVVEIVGTGKTSVMSTDYNKMIDTAIDGLISIYTYQTTKEPRELK